MRPIFVPNIRQHCWRNAAGAMICILALAAVSCDKHGGDAEQSAADDAVVERRPTRIASGLQADIPATARDDRPSILLIGLDTLRRDHVHYGGADWIRTPHLDALAADGVQFARCQSTAPWTLPSFASIFTGLLPYRHGAIGGDRLRLADEFVTMAEHLTAAGFASTGIAGINYLTDQCGMSQGFGARFPIKREEVKGDQASMTNIMAGNFVRHYRDRPFFLFAHYFTVHAPYEPPAEFGSLYYEGDARAGGEPILPFLRSRGNLDLDDNTQMYDWLEGVTDMLYPVKQYAGEVTYVDAKVGELIALLKELDLYEDMLIVMVSDHGEHLGEHGIYFTHYLPYQETLHVPLIVKLPGGRHAGKIVDAPVSTLDLLPTVLEIVGLPVPKFLDGRSLGDLIAGREPPPRSPLLSEQGSDEDRFVKALLDWPWKLMALQRDGDLTYELYDLAADPGETRDIATERPQQVERLQTYLWETFPPERPLVADVEVPAAELDAKAVERLRALGYVD